MRNEKKINLTQSKNTLSEVLKIISNKNTSLEVFKNLFFDKLSILQERIICI
jgi:hypothetical protein